MADASTARAAVFAAIEAAAKDLGNLNQLQKAQAVANLALAWRYVYGGQQPGGYPPKD